MEKLTIAQVGPYLPYAVKIKTGANVIRELVVDIPKDEEIKKYVPIQYVINGMGHSLILRPMSDLTKEIEHNEEKFIPVSFMLEEFGDTETFEFYLLQLITDHLNHKRFPYQIIDLIISWHFDVFGLIEKGLAIDINKLESEVK